MTLALANDGNKSHLFQEDDEETWRLIVMPQMRDEASNRLANLAVRMEEDVHADAESAFWNGICRDLERRGFRFQRGAIQTVQTALAIVPAGQSNGGGAAKGNQPGAFQSEDGRSHLAAVSALLRLSESRAVEVTMSALRSIDTDGSRLQELMGTRELLLKTLRYHHQQRLARLGVLTEALRLEQDDSVDNQDSAAMLQNLDDAYDIDGGKKRGIFRRLLFLACKPNDPPARHQFEPMKKLRENRSKVSTSATSFSSMQSWNAFVSDCVHIMTCLEVQERLEALEGLLIYLYQRIDGGVCRFDFAAILVAFSSCKQFFTGFTANRRLSQLAGLICAECMSLWRVLEDNSDWVESHPMLTGLISGDAEAEIEMLRSMVADSAAQVVTRLTQHHANRSPSTVDVVDVPESITMMAFGLLLYLSYASLLSSDRGGDADAFWQTLYGSGLDMVQTANDKGGSIDYLHSLLEDLAGRSDRGTVIAQDTPFYDWQLDTPNQLSLSEVGDETSATDGAALAYTSIAKELLLSFIVAFQDSILSIDHDASCDNIGTLCNLAAVIYANNNALCADFWNEWYKSTSTDDSSDAVLPMAHLLDAAYSLAVSGQQTANVTTDVGMGELFLSAATPLLQMLAATCFDAKSMQEALRILPQYLIGQIIIFCKPLSNNLHTPQFQKLRSSALQALITFVRNGKSNGLFEETTQAFRVPNDDDSQNSFISTLASLLHGTIDVKSARDVIALVKMFLDDSDPAFLSQLMRILNSSQIPQAKLSHLLSQNNDATDAASHLLGGFIEHLPAVAFSDIVSDADTIRYLHDISDCLEAVNTVLASSPSTAASFHSSGTRLANATAYSILTCQLNLLDEIGVIIKAHSSAVVQQTAAEVRARLIINFSHSPGLGHSIAHYASSPIAMALLIRLQSLLDDTNVLDAIVTSEGESQNFGAWASMMSTKTASKETESGPQKDPAEHLTRWFDTFEGSDIDVEVIQTRRDVNISDSFCPIKLASIAINVLARWSAHANEMVSENASANRSQQSDIGNLTYMDLGPDAVLTSPALVPSGSVVDTTAIGVWKSVSLNNLDLILRYLPTMSDTDRRVEAMVIPALDLLRGYINNAHASLKLENSTLIRTLQSSSTFLKKFMAFAQGNLHGGSGRNQKTLITTMMSLGLVGTMIKSDTSIALGIFEDGAGLLHAVAKELTGVVNLLQSSRGDYDNVIFGNKANVSHLRLAASMLNVMDQVWPVCMQSLLMSDEKKYAVIVDAVEKIRQGVVNDLISLIVDHSSMIRSSDTGREPATTSTLATELSKTVAMDLHSSALHIVTVDVIWKLQSPTATSQDIANIGLSRLRAAFATVAKDYATAEGVSTVGDTSTELNNTLMAFHHQSRAQSLVKVLADCFPSIPANSSVDDAYTRGNRYNPNAMATTLAKVASRPIDGTAASRSTMTADASQWIELSNQTCLSNQLLRAEQTLQQRWQDFSQIAIATARDDIASGQLTRAQLVGFASAVMDALAAAASNFERIPADLSRQLLEKEIVMMASSQAETLLYIVEAIPVGTQQGAQSDAAAMLKLLMMLANTCKRVFAILIPSTDDKNSTGDKHQICCGVMQPLVLAMMVLTRHCEGDATIVASQYATQRDDAYSACAQVAAKILEVLQSWIQPKQPKQEKLCDQLLASCMSLLSTLVARRSTQSMQSSQDRFMLRLANILDEHHVIRIILFQAASTPRASEITGNATDTWASASQRQAVQLLQSAIEFMTLVTASRHSSMLSLVAKSGIAQVIIKNPIFLRAAARWNSYQQGQPPRGYVMSEQLPTPTEYAGSSKFRQADPVHEVWLSTLEFISCSLRTIHRRADAGTATMNSHTKFFYDLAATFMASYQHLVLGCLQYLAADDVPFTCRSLEEAKHCFSFLTCWFDRDWNEVVMRRPSNLMQDFAASITQSVVRLSKFLSASGTSRELFRALAEFHTADAGTYGVTVPVNPLLAGGLPNAKHEAIRYSLLVSACVTAATRQDMDASKTIPDHLKQVAQDQPGDSYAEPKSRKFVTNAFILDVEHRVAGCVTEAISLLSNAHPAASSFVHFTREEAARMNSMALVKPRSIIAYRSANENPLFGTDQLHSHGANEHICFGRVLEVDTVNQMWKVQMIQRTSNLHTAATNKIDSVSTDRLAGYEDVSKRRYVAQYQAGLDNATDLEESKDRLSLGHLILILQWCHHNYGSGLSRSATVRRLAEETTRLLGIDLSIHHELGSPISIKSSKRLALAKQLKDLFEAPENEGVSSPTAVAQAISVGKLKPVLCAQVWDAVKAQMAQELQFVEQCNKTHVAAQGGRSKGVGAAGGMDESWFGTRRAGSNRSPFRSIR